ncbi:MAG: NlpC/P60 family protein [Heliomarina sp.]|uniref:NlpC/P60 family protein n=1 Tax=Heliomarina sp. TaxID=2917556 RepID=UPI0040593DDC
MNFDVRRVQSRLADLGFNPGPIDGLRGPKTDAAIIAFKRSKGLRPRAYVGPITLAAIKAAWRAQRQLVTDASLPWVDIAEGVLGLHETRDNAELKRFLACDGHALGDPAVFPWCGDLIETCIRVALPNEPFPGALGQNPYWALNWRLFGIETVPTFGAICSVERNGGGHVFFLMGEDETTWYALGGNQSNAVSRARISKSRKLAGCRWPATYPERPIFLPRMEPGDLTLTTNEA